MTEVEALKEAMIYIAECLEQGQAYRVTDDQFVRGEDLLVLLAEFARKRAGKDNTAWLKWCVLRANASYPG